MPLFTVITDELLYQNVSQPQCRKACCDRVLSDVFSSVKVATDAWNIIYSRPAVLVYSLVYSYTFSVIIVPFFFFFFFLFFLKNVTGAAASMALVILVFLNVIFFA